ncbi:MAG: tRNA (adenosine(37)-N6)-threonylcarbamoyltransferase complex dimerization subunit type 1 TsaB [Acidimicrobiia bacterium]|nr:tRNA (adenosine(37)-N6)-threonylcarbamoyltransferase complex dimerization subunit type 1 TsaB [Acidimicrobiia bacterium]MYC45619.1 tRNA (adenosine(37)-N6)-threonylcarbamoyltransferase complex dimerization subunit type 1 TsaB [Acidimicrobiia bacterium]
MLVLGIESASDQCGCALANENGVIAETRLALPRRHAEALAPQMRFVCEQAGVALGDVDVVAVDCGPGLYTGLRAGLATAKATAAALETGVVPIGSLEALAFGAAAVAQPGETVLSVLDARRGEVFWAWYRITTLTGSTARLVRLSAPQVGPPADLLPALTSPGENPSGRTVVVGDGALRYADQLAAGNAVIAGPELRFPSPAAVALLGRERALAGGTVPPEQVDALYLRSPDAQPQR